MVEGWSAIYNAAAALPMRERGETLLCTLESDGTSSHSCDASRR